MLGTHTLSTPITLCFLGFAQHRVTCVDALYESMLFHVLFLWQIVMWIELRYVRSYKSPLLGILRPINSTSRLHAYTDTF